MARRSLAMPPSLVHLDEPVEAVLVSLPPQPEEAPAGQEWMGEEGAED